VKKGRSGEGRAQGEENEEGQIWFKSRWCRLIEVGYDKFYDPELERDHKHLLTNISVSHFIK
jgi:hypothetical protein